MKSLVWITTIVAFAFGFNPNYVQAEAESFVETSELRSGGTATYDEASQQITLELRTDDLERASIWVADENGNVVFHEKVTVNSRGLEMKISLQGLDSGVYQLKVNSTSISMGERFKKK